MNFQTKENYFKFENIDKNQITMCHLILLLKMVILLGDFPKIFEYIWLGLKMHEKFWFSALFLT